MLDTGWLTELRLSVCLIELGFVGRHPGLSLATTFAGRSSASSLNVGSADIHQSQFGSKAADEGMTTDAAAKEHSLAGYKMLFNCIYDPLPAEPVSNTPKASAVGVAPMTAGLKPKVTRGGTCTMGMAAAGAAARTSNGSMVVGTVVGAALPPKSAPKLDSKNLPVVNHHKVALQPSDLTPAIGQKAGTATEKPARVKPSSKRGSK